MATKGRFSRRGLIRSIACGAGALAATSILAACAQPAPATPTSAPAPPKPAAAEPTKPVAEPTKPVAATPQPTTAPAPTPAPAAKPAVSAKAPVTIQVTGWYVAGEQLKQLYSTFEAKHPNTKIEHVSYAGIDHMQFLVPRTQSPQPPDCMNTCPANFLPMSYGGALENLDPYVKTDSKALELDQWEKWMLEEYSSVAFPELKPGTYGVPTKFWYWPFYFNRKMFQEAGLELPKKGWTIEEFHELARKLTKPEKKQFGFAQPARDMTQYSWMWRFGGEVITPDKTKVLIDSEECIQAMEFIQKMMVEEKLMPRPDMMAAEAGGMNFDTGRVAMALDGSWKAGGSPFNEDWKKLDWMIGWPPKGKREAIMIEHGGLSMFKVSKHKDEAWEFIRFSAGPDGQAFAAEVVGDVVANARVWKEKGFIKVRPDAREVAIQVRLDPAVRPVPLWFRPKYTSAYVAGQEMAALWTGEAKARTLLPDLARRVNEALAQPPTIG